jgi:ribosomal protein S3
MPDPNFSNGSSKCSKHPHPPLSTPPGHVAFRLLCYASRISGVIGKSRTVIKNLQQSTAAKIRIKDTPLDSLDRVILVMADAALTGKLGLKNRNEEEIGEEVMEVSKAQEALVKVFDTILEVAAESDGLGVGVGVVSCRLLAEAAQVGSIIGQRGKVVEKIRKDSSSKINGGEREIW